MDFPSDTEFPKEIVKFRFIGMIDGLMIFHTYETEEIFTYFIW